MNNKKLYIRLVALLTVTLLISLGFNGKVFSTNGASAKEKLDMGQRFSLPFEQQEWAKLAQGTSGYSGYTEITDNEEKITAEVPVEWNDIETGPWMSKGKSVGVFVAASGDLANFYSSRSQPGVFIGVSSSLAHTYDKDGLLGLERRDVSRKCLLKGRFDYQNQFYSGKYDHFTNCAGGVPNLLVFTTASADRKSLILIRIVIVSQADLEAADTIINSFQVLGNPEQDDHHEN